MAKTKPMTAFEHRRLRTAAKLSQSELADKLGCAVSTVVRRENGVITISDSAAADLLLVVDRVVWPTHIET